MEKQIYSYSKVIDGKICNCVVKHESNEIQFFYDNRFMDVWVLLFTITSQEQLSVYVESAFNEWEKIAG